MGVYRCRVSHQVLQMAQHGEGLFSLGKIAQQQRQMGNVPQGQDLGGHAAPLTAELRRQPVVIAGRPEVGHDTVQDMGQVGVGPGSLVGQVAGSGQFYGPCQGLDGHLWFRVVEHPHCRQRIGLHVHCPQALGHAQRFLAEVQCPVRHAVKKVGAGSFVHEPGELGTLPRVPDGVQALLAQLQALRDVSIPGSPG